MTVADVAFDVPLHHPFSYRVPEGWTVTPGQRVVAPLGRATRTGVVVALRERTEDAPLKPLLRVLDAHPVLDARGLASELFAAGAPFVSPGVVEIDEPGYPFPEGFLVRDPDGHVLQVMQSVTGK